jgi:hypothetical protein
LGALGRKHLEFLVGGDQAGLALLQLRGLRAQRRVGLLGALHRARTRLHQVVITLAFFLREFQVGFGRVDLGGLLLDQRLLQVDLGVEVAHSGVGRRNIGLGLVQRGLEIAVVNPRKQLASLDRLVVRNQHLGDIARHLRRDDRGVGLDVGVVRRLQILARGQIVVAKADSAGDAKRQGQRQGGLLDRQTRRR